MEIKYAPFTSSIHPGFWSALSKLKLEVLGLEESAVEVHGHYENKFQPNIPSLLTLEWNAFETEALSESNWCTYRTNGAVINYNTLEAFKNFDKNLYLKMTEGNLLHEAMTSGQVLNNPSILTRFVCHMFADLKKYHYYYWFAYPAFILPNSIQMSEPVKPISEVFDSDFISNLGKTYIEWKKVDPIQSGFFWIQSKPLLISNLKDGFDKEGAMLGFADPSSLSDYPGWPLRNLLAFIGHHKLELLKQGLKILCLRQTAKDGNLDIQSSIILNIKCVSDSTEDFKCQLQVTGWEKNDKKQFGPKFANMKSSMDPKSLAQSSGIKIYSRRLQKHRICIY